MWNHDLHRWDARLRVSSWTPARCDCRSGVFFIAVGACACTSRPPTQVAPSIPAAAQVVPGITEGNRKPLKLQFRSA